MGNTLVAYLHRKDGVGANFHKSLTNLLFHDQGRHVAACSDTPAGPASIDLARNNLMLDFLERDPAVEWLFMVDDDMGFEPDVLDKLHSVADPVERPLVGGLAFAQRDLEDDGLNGYGWRAKPTIFDYADPGDGQGRRLMYRHWYPVNSLIKCDSTGGAFVLIHRSVGIRILEEQGPNWFTRFEDVQGLMSEDHSFFTRCHELGYPLHIHTGARTNHCKSTWLNESTFWEHADPPPATERVDVIVPVLHRPQNVAPFMESLIASTGLATAWFVCDRDDRGEQEAVLAAGGRVLKCDGTFAEKVNYAYGKVAPQAPWLLLVGDDVQFRPGWWDHALFTAWATPGTNVVGTNDLGNARVLRGEHATHMAIRRSYIDEVGSSWDGPGAVCHPYRHWYVDDEIVTAARMRGVFQSALGSVVEHMHPLFGKAVNDDVYALGQSFADEDRATFLARLGEAKAAA